MAHCWVGVPLKEPCICQRVCRCIWPAYRGRLSTIQSMRIRYAFSDDGIWRAKIKFDAFLNVWSLIYSSGQSWRSSSWHQIYRTSFRRRHQNLANGILDHDARRPYNGRLCLWFGVAILRSRRHGWRTSSSSNLFAEHQRSERLCAQVCVESSGGAVDISGHCARHLFEGGQWHETAHATAWLSAFAIADVSTIGCVEEKFARSVKLLVADKNMTIRWVGRIIFRLEMWRRGHTKAKSNVTVVSNTN